LSVCSQLAYRKRGVLDRPVRSLNLSVRAAWCMTRLDIWTIGDLVQHSADELLQAKNFSLVSLHEVRAKLVPYGLMLRGDPCTSRL
jgi:DNA-directed RNA polymerase subunit alpha